MRKLCASNASPGTVVGGLTGVLKSVVHERLDYLLELANDDKCAINNDEKKTPGNVCAEAGQIIWRDDSSMYELEGGWAKE